MQILAGFSDIGVSFPGLVEFYTVNLDCCAAMPNVNKSLG